VPFEKFVDSPYYSESKVCEGAVTVSFSKVPPLASDALLTTLRPLIENMFQAVCHKLQEDSGAGSVLGLPLRGSSFTFVSPSLKSFHHLKTAARLIASSP
jgi:hypothetical protein